MSKPDGSNTVTTEAMEFGAIQTDSTLYIPCDNNLNYSFSLSAGNTVGYGPASSSTAYQKIPSSVINARPHLFNISSFDIISEPYRQYFIDAANKLNAFITVDNVIRNALNGVGWTSVSLANLNMINENTALIAACAVSDYKTLTRNNRTIFISSMIDLTINQHYSYFTRAQWIKSASHELCHGLGIGTLWYYNAISNDVLSGTLYPQTRTAYNVDAGVVRSGIPLENSGGPGTAGGHWEDNFRGGATTYPGIVDDLMVGTIKDRMVLSNITIRNLVDIGYSEVVPGTVEGMPNIDNGLTTASLGEPHRFCGTICSGIIPTGEIIRID